MKYQWKSGIMGVVVGDALGCPVQFESRKQVAQHPVTGMRGFGTFNLPAGSWTDDSSLTLALLESIRRSGGIDCVDIMDNFVRWLDDGAFTPYGYSYDVGGVTRAALQRYKRTGDPYTCGGMHASDNGNGSLMRIMPAVLYCIDKELPDGEAMDVIHRVGSLTHGHLRAKIACGLYGFTAKAILLEKGDLAARIRVGLGKGLAYYDDFIVAMDLPFEDYAARKQDLKCYDRLRDVDAFGALDADDIRGSGYVVDTLEAAVWSLLTTDSFPAALLKAVNLGEDTDTVAAVAGGLAGLYYGYDAIPGEWLAALQRRDWIEELLD
jgi:ADP-ribosylglycohydrolase